MMIGIKSDKQKLAEQIFKELEETVDFFEVHENCTVEETDKDDCPQCRYERLKKRLC